MEGAGGVAELSEIRLAVRECQNPNSVVLTLC